MRLLLAGDTHGNLHHTKQLFFAAEKYEVDTIVQLGDFGYWPHVENYAESVNQYAAMNKIRFYWLDGNHENFDALEKAVDMKANDPQQMGTNLFYLPRGSCHDFGGLKVLVLGGAVSIDRKWRQAREDQSRKPGTLWWHQEQINNDDILRAKSHGKVDLMFTHDMPDECFIANFPDGYKADEASRENRQKVSEVMKYVQPKALFHGHMHHAYFDHIYGTDVRGLDCDDSGLKSWYILDTDEYLDK